MPLGSQRVVGVGVGKDGGAFPRCFVIGGPSDSYHGKFEMNTTYYVVVLVTAVLVVLLRKRDPPCEHASPSSASTARPPTIRLGLRLHRGSKLQLQRQRWSSRVVDVQWAALCALEQVGRLQLCCSWLPSRWLPATLEHCKRATLGDPYDQLPCRFVQRPAPAPIST